MTGSPGPNSTRYWIWSAVGIGAVLLLIALAVAVGRMTSTGADATPTTVTGTTSPPALTRPAAPAGVGPGVYIVGTDIQPGTYRTDGAAPRRYTDGYCMWSRHDNVGGGPFDGIIASDGSFDGQMIVTIEPDDQRFMTRGCHPWTPVPQ